MSLRQIVWTDVICSKARPGTQGIGCTDRAPVNRRPAPSPLKGSGVNDMNSAMAIRANSGAGREAIEWSVGNVSPVGPPTQPVDQATAGK